MQPTFFPGLNRVLQELIRGGLLRSFAVGDFNAHSGTDFSIAVQEPLMDAEVDALHARIRDPDNPWAARLDGSYFPADMLKRCARRKECLRPGVAHADRPRPVVARTADPHDYQWTLELLGFIMEASRKEDGTLLTPWP